MIDSSPFGSDVGNKSIARFSTSYDVSVAVTGRSGRLALTPVAGSLVDDARATPRISATFTVAMPDQATLAYLDPVQQSLTLWVAVGYQEVGRAGSDTQTLYKLGVIGVEEDYIAGTVTLTCASDEAVVLGQAADQTYSYSTSNSYGAAIRALVGDAFPGQVLTWSIDDGLSGQLFAAAAAVAIGDDRWDAVSDWADVLQAKVWHDGLGTWYVTPAPALPTAQSAASLNTGEQGSVTDLKRSRTRAGFASQVIVRYEYQVGTARFVDVGIATAGLRPIASVTVQRTRKPVDTASAGRAAANLLKRGLRRFNVWTIEGAARFWLRSWDTVTVRGPNGLTARLLVEAVTYDFAASSMVVTGQAPVQAHLPLITVTSSHTTL